MSFLDIADINHMNQGDKKIVSYLELLKQREEDDNKQLLAKKITRIPTKIIKKNPTMISDR